MTNHAHNQASKLAILGGVAARPQGPPVWPPFDADVAKVLQDMAADGSWGRYEGRNCDTLTEEICRLVKCESALLCASGTVGVELALRGVKVRAGDEVVLAAYDFRGNCQDVLALGAVPVLIDVAAENWNFDPTLLADAINEKTRAIVVSHLHGGIVPMQEVMKIARSRGVAVIEDACQCPGATVCGQPAGSMGDVGVFSFGGSKLLTAGRGGAIFTNQPEIMQRVKLYSQRGNWAYPLSELQAAVLVPQMKILRQRNQQRDDHVAKLLAELASISECGLKPLKNRVKNSEAGFYKLGFQYHSDMFSGLSRELFCKAMRAEGVAMDAGFRGLHCSHSRRRFRALGSLPEATRADQQMVVLHHPVLLEDSNAMTEIVSAITKIQRHANLLVDSKM